MVDELRARGWTVYQEVTVAGSVCDIVAVNGNVLWAIEAKVNLGLTVLAQARAWQSTANLVSIAVPDGRRSSTRNIAIEAAGLFGLGVLEIHDPNRYDWLMRGKPSRILEIVRPLRRRHAHGMLRAALRDEQQYFAAAGNADGKRWTPFASTCDALRTVLARGPMTIREAVLALRGRHHYANEVSARGSIYQWAKAGAIAGVELIPGGKGQHARVGLVKDPTASG